ncbi:cytochrome P450 18a1-like [Uloborus diversus]|uniref:cytochrome P450 18a1-like n=1 Tax=Uloborus diversus TaxID=327109 RepID=UPI0024094D8C|nr:cytochrome P450 18a1-like [Uloborus diversus]
MELTTLVLVSAFVVLVSLWYASRKKDRNPLPGPIGLPIVGYLPFMTTKPYIKFTKLVKRYGPIYSVRLGSRNVVILADFNVTKEAFASDAFMGRPPDLPFDLSETTKKTGAFLDMPWKEQRRFSLHMLRDLGFGKTKMEEHLKEEIVELLERMDQLEGKPTKMSNILAPSMSNNIASLLFGKRLKHDDPKRIKLDNMLSDVGKLAGATAWQLFFPFLNNIFEKFEIGNTGKLLHALREVRQYVRDELDEHEKTLDHNNIRDFMDGYLLEMEKKVNDPMTTFKRDVLVDLGRAFFGAGSETVRISVDWMLLICAHFPEVQRKMYSEIQEVLGHERFPTRADHLNMPYTEAVILEMNRWKTIIPINLMRYTLQDTELNGYFIPKHSYVLSVIYAVHHDKKLWGADVEEFKPERFLSEDRKKVVKPEFFIPFSIGKRQCPGKVFAEVEVFLYVAAILQRFEISLPPGKQADLEGMLGIGLQPKRQDLVFKRRS